MPVIYAHYAPAVSKDFADFAELPGKFPLYVYIMVLYS
jgi:hypothetical protein